jgi:hypothetical protein
MRSALIHGVLLAVMLVYGYRTWTRDKSIKPDLGSVVLWNKSEAELASIEFKSEKKTVRLDRKTDGKESYWWGTETSIEKKPKPKPAEPKPAPTDGSGSAGSGSAAKAGSGSGSAAGSGSAVAAGSGSAKAGSGSAVAAGSGSAKAGSGSAVAAGSGSAKAGSGSGSSAVAAGSGSAGSGSGSATPAIPPPPIEMVETTKRREFPLGDGGDKVIKAFTEARAVGDLGKPTPDQLVEFKLGTKDQIEAKLTEVKKELDAAKAEETADKDKEKEDNKDKDPKDKKKPAKKADKKPDLQKRIKELEDQKKNADKPRTTLIVTFSDGSTRAFFVGGSIYGGTDRYVLDQSSGSAYVLSKDMVASLEVGESSLHLTDPRGFDAAKIEQVEVDWAGRKKVAKRVEAAGADGKQVKTWNDTDTGKANQPLATFIDNVNNLRPTEYAKDLKVDAMTPVFRLEYKDAAGAKLGSLALYKIEKAPIIPDGVDFDPANPPKGEIEYYVVTERTRVPALVRKDPAQKSEEDLPIVFGDKAAPTAPVAPKPGANPFGNVPTRPSGGSGAHGGGSGKEPRKH